MKKIIRKGVFESNSSSSHSLVITKSTEVESLDDVWMRDGMIQIWGDVEFGRSPNAPLTDFDGKLKYLIAVYFQHKDKIAEIVETVKRIVPDCKGIEFPEQYLRGSDSYVADYGYIDHQSSHILRNYLEKHNVSFEEFLTNKRYVMVLDGDEYGMWGKFKESGLINEDYIEKEIGIYDENYY